MGKLLKFMRRGNTLITESTPLNMGLHGDFSPEGLAGLFPFGWVQCAHCGAYYCSKEVYYITHQPPYEFRCECGPQGLYLRWKVEMSQSPQPEICGRPGLWQKSFKRLRQGLMKIFRGE